LASSLDGEDVHGVDLETGDLVTTGEEGSVLRRSLGRGTHTVLVVLTDEDTGEVPEFGLGLDMIESDETGGEEATHHVVSLKDLTLVRGTVTVESESAALLLQVLLGKRDTSSDGDLGTDDTVSTEERGGEDVHRTSLSERHTVDSAWRSAKVGSWFDTRTHQLSDDTLNGSASEDGKGVASVGSDDSVVTVDGSLHTDRDGLLSNSQVAETSDHLLLVKRIGSLLHSSHGSLSISLRFWWNL
jgi:hypothetical protein